MSLEKVIAAEKKFNKRYVVKFIREELDQSTSGLADFGVGSTADQLYCIMFADLYKKAFGNYVDHKTECDFDFVRMINEFEREIMDPYREYCKGEKTPPKPYGGITLGAHLNSFNSYLDGVSGLKSEFVKQRYMGGDLRIRDMRAYINSLKNREDISDAELSTVDCYIKGLSSFSNNRSFLSKIGMLFTFIGEQRAISEFTKFLETKTGGALTADENVNPRYCAISDISDRGEIFSTKQSVYDALNNTLENERRNDPENVEKENLLIDESVFSNDTEVSNKIEDNKDFIKNGLEF